MKHKRYLLYPLLLIAILSVGCGAQTGSKIETQNTVENTINDQIRTEEASDSSVLTNIEDPYATDDTSSENTVSEDSKTTGTEEDYDAVIITDTEESDTSEETEDAEESDSDVDIDLTKMNSDMVYATVYQMMVEPEDYIGKTIKMSGDYYASWYDLTSKYYHYVVIQDATACCAQGIEFVWGTGDHIYPQDYPDDYTEVTVEGVFETYTEGDPAALYCRLNNATLVIDD